jgi:hypothetical protein
MKVDINFYVRGDEYTPQVGTEYEISPGVWAKLKYPTIGLQRKIGEAATKEDADQVELAILCLDGAGEVQSDDVIAGMPAVVMRDFSSLVTMTIDRLVSESPGSEELLQGIPLEPQK